MQYRDDGEVNRDKRRKMGGRREKGKAAMRKEKDGRIKDLHS